MNKVSDSLTTLCALLVCAMTLLSILSMSIPRNRSAVRAELCQRNLKKIALGMHNYHSAYKRLPAAVGGSSGNGGYQGELSSEHDSNQGRLSGFAAILGFVEQQPAWEQLSNRRSEGEFPPMGPAPSYDPGKYKLWATQFDIFLCPSDPVKRKDFGLRSYMMNYGDGVDSVGRLFDDSPEDEKLQRLVSRGMFTPHRALKFRDIRDGMSNTIMLGETIIGVGSKNSAATIARAVPGLVASPAVAIETLSADGKQYHRNQKLWSVGKGSRWPEGSFVLNAFTTVLPPGGPSATLPLDPESGCVSASSYHPNGVNILMCDGAVRFVSDSIDVGDLSAKSIAPGHDNAGQSSPYGVWGAMGTRSGKEIIPSEREAKFKTYN